MGYARGTMVRALQLQIQQTAPQTTPQQRAKSSSRTRVRRRRHRHRRWLGCNPPHRITQPPQRYRPLWWSGHRRGRCRPRHSQSGTRPIALLDPLRFGSMDSLHTRWLFDNVVRGIADYGNCIGVPTVGGEVEFDTFFERNCLVDVVCVGLGRKDKLVLGEARDPGDLVYLVGGRTGRDGIRGASFASKTLAEKSDTERSAVQVPDPFTKKLVIEAILEAVDAKIIQGMKDLGGGGLTCGLSEIAAKAGTGMEIDLNRVQTR